MLDGQIRKLSGPWIEMIGQRLATAGFSANTVTFAGFAAGILAMIAIASHSFLLGLSLIGLNRLCDGLDGAVARASTKTDFGGFLDIVLDFAFYGAVPLGFVIADPQGNGLAGAVLIFSFYCNGASFLAFSVLAEKRTMISAARGEKSLYFTTGLAEATETIFVFALMCIFPAMFGLLAYLFALVCFYTAISRVFLARLVFG